MTRLVITIFAAFFAACLAQDARADERPNILLIIVDDLRVELPSYGAKHVTAPNIESLARSGVVFQNAYANVPVCGASRASLMTGIRPTATRFVDYGARADEDTPDATTLHALFKRAGYQAESLGKVMHILGDSADGWSRKPWRPVSGQPEELRSGHQDYQLTENIEAYLAGGHGPAFEAADVGDNAYFDGKIAYRAIKTLERLEEGDKPFFLAVGFVKPHLPFNAPLKYWEKYSREDIELATIRDFPTTVPRAAHHSWGELRKFTNIPEAPVRLTDDLARELRHGYYAAISYADVQVGRVLRALERLELEDDTIVVLIGDHGWSLGEHGLWAKHSTFDVATRSPLIVRVPGVEATGSAEGLVEFVDIYPTLAELAGITPPDQLQGESFVTQIRDPAATGKEAVFLRWKSGEVIKTPDFALTQWYDEAGAKTAAMLFDHREDRAETVNLMKDEDYTQAVEDLRRRLEESIQSR